MKFLNIFFILFSALLMTIHISCEKGIYNQTYNINCNTVQNGIINSDADAIISEINKLVYDLPPKVTSFDEFGHKQNIDVFIERINKFCPSVTAKLICYACIETYPPQSEIELSTISSDIEYIRILDIWTSPEEILRFRTIHDNE